ncbi:MAG: UDP-glucose/GDP-mannose dehydrogenase family protein [Clostridiaceae bacterium]|nr:UDP-glucose/GDP-mannose dehydrogenase family protein [Clostridiaceae bacterium]
MNISVIGTGYTGLITGACLADLGMNVICVDKNEDVIKRLENSEIPFYEPGLDALISRNNLLKKLHFTTNTKDAVENSSSIFIIVGTPSLKDGSVNLKYIYQAANEIANCINCYKLIIIKSTVPVGTCKRIKRYIEDILKNANKNVEFDIISNPEFLREGAAISDFNFPDRIVIGTDNEKAAIIMKDIYKASIFQNTPIIFTTLETAEMIKYASNAFLAAKISYINEIANICELSGADVSVVAKAMGLDKRIGEKFLNPGPGFGGSCFPKDTKALIKTAKDLGYKPEIISSVMKSNLLQRKRMVQKIVNAVGEPENKAFTLLGLAFKPETADIRESSSIYIIEELLRMGGIIRAYDPEAMNNMKKMHPELSIKYCDDELTACEGSDCIIIATEWEQFRDIDFRTIKGIVNKPVVIDLRNMFEPSYIKDNGFLYLGIGRQ